MKVLSFEAGLQCGNTFINFGLRMQPNLYLVGNCRQRVVCASVLKICIVHFYTQKMHNTLKTFANCCRFVYFYYGIL